MNKIAIALLLGAFCAVGCGDKTDAAGSGSAKASGTAKSTGTAAATGTSAAGSSGSKTCDDYWAKLKACNEASLKNVPDGAQKDEMKKQLDEAEKTTKEAWKAMEGAALDSACKTALDALAQNPACPKE